MKENKTNISIMILIVIVLPHLTKKSKKEVEGSSFITIYTKKQESRTHLKTHKNNLS